MADIISHFAKKVCDYTINEDNKTISGEYISGPIQGKFQPVKLFKMNGTAAKLLINELMKIEDAG
jgi:hypothetical protein